MSKKIPLLLIFLLTAFGLHAQGECPLHIRVSTEVGNCYNNAKVQIDLTDVYGNPLDTSLTDFTDFKYFCFNTSGGDTTFSFTNVFFVAPGTYKVGVQAVCYYSTLSDSMYVRMERDTVVTTSTSYITPVLSMISHIAGSSEDFGMVPALSCVNSGRIQVSIRGGSFPYYVKVCDSLDQPLDTLVFYDHQYSGEDESRFDYKDYYSIGGLAAGTYNLYVWDGCGYFMPKVWQEITTDALPYIYNLCWYYSSGNPTDSNVVKTRVYVQKPSGYYASFVPDVIEYRFLYPIGGVYDTSEWKRLPAADYSGTGIAQIILYDTAYPASRYCDMFDSPIIFEAHNTLCDEMPFTSSYTYARPTAAFFNAVSTLVSDSSVIEPLQYDSCGYTSSKTTTFGHHEYYIYYQYSSNNYSSCSSGSNYYKNHHYATPLYWVYTDTLTNHVIKVDTLTTITAISRLKGSDIISVYGEFADSPITVPVRRTLYDSRGCELYTRFDDLTFSKATQITGGNYLPLRFFCNFTSSYNDYCCNSVRSVNLYSAYSPPMPYLGDVVVKLVESPLKNKYNFTATYDRTTGQWGIVRDSLSNLARIEHTSGTNFKVEDYCLPSGRYTFRITTACSTYVVNASTTFKDTYEYIPETPVYEYTPHCTELLIKPVSGKYTFLRHNTNMSTGLPYTIATDRSSVFEIISGPSDGYTNVAVGLDGTLRITRPGTYVIRMKPSGTYYCDPEFVYDTVVFTGGTVEYEYDYAYVCDSSSTIGFVRLKGQNGTPPYIYTIYSEPDAGGIVLGENTSGVFNDVPLSDGQHISARIMDSCGAGFYANFTVFDMEKVSKSWFEGGAKVMQVCEGSHITVYALGKEEIFSYEWTGPNGFSAHTQEAGLFVPRDAEDGYYKVRLLATGCTSPITDSVYVNMKRAGKVTIAEETSFCPGEEVSLTFTAAGTGDVHYTIGHEENSVTTYQSYTNSDSYTYRPTISGTFWVHEVHDDLCAYSVPEDTINVTLKEQVASACDVIAIPDTVCIDSAVRLSAYSTLDAPYILRWYQDFEQHHLLKSDTIYDAGDRSHYDIPQLMRDTVLYVTAYDDTHCESRYGTVSRWMNMHDGSTTLRCGESIRFFDSGGMLQDYGRNESLIHVFTSSDGNPVTLQFNDFNTESTFDRLLVFTGAGADPDSLIATLSSDLSGSLPADIVSNSPSMTVWFLSNGSVERGGWDAVVGNSPYPASVTASVTPRVGVAVAVATDEPTHYNGSATLRATASGGKGQQYAYQWLVSSDSLTWTPAHTEITHDTAYFTLHNIIEQMFVRTIVQDASAEACGGSDTATLSIPVANIRLSLRLSVYAEDPCNTSCTAVLTVENNGTAAADNVVSHLHLPDILSLPDLRDTIVTTSRLAAGGSVTDTFRILFTTRPAGDTTLAIKAQIWSCLQGDSVPETVYGDWDWQDGPRQADEDSANVYLKRTFAEEDYHLTAYGDEVCYGGNAQLSASSDVDVPQYYNWYADPLLETLLKRDTLDHIGGMSHFDLDSLRRPTTLYVTVQNSGFCPPTAIGASDISFDGSVTQTVLMGNGVTEVGMSDRIKFYDSGGPGGKCQAGEDYIHTFHATDGLVKIRINQMYAYNGSFYLYDGADINAPLIIQVTNKIFSNLVFTSSSESMTVRFVSSGTATYWDADIINPIVTIYKQAEASASIRPAARPVDLLRATDAEICYGNDATLTATADISYPQYFVWYASDMTPVLSDTIHAGSSVLQLHNQKRNDVYHISVWNDTTTCAPTEYRPARELCLTSDMDLKSSVLKPDEAIRFYDSGGPLGNMHYDNSVTYTFKTDPGYQIAIQFDKINVYWSSYIFKLYDGDSVDEGRRLVYLNSKPLWQTIYMSTGNSLTLNIPYQNYGEGWDALVYVVDPIVLNPDIRHDTTLMQPGHSYRFLDDGGPNDNYSKNITQPVMHTFHSDCGDIVASIKSWSLYSKDTLYIYKGGGDDPSKLVTALTGTCSIVNIHDLNDRTVTFKFAGHNPFNSSSGWDIVLRTRPETVLAHAHVRIGTEYVDRDIVTTDDTICYGEDARLTAFSASAGTPKLYTWYAPNGLDVLKRDTLYAGVSELTLPHQTQDNTYWVTVAPEGTCPVVPNTDTTFVENVTFGASGTHRTVIVSPADSLIFTDIGGIANHYINQPTGTYTMTFTATREQLRARFDNSTYNRIYGLDTLYVYDGTGESDLLFKGTGATFAGKEFLSSGGSLTFKFVKKSITAGAAGWVASIVCTEDTLIAKASVAIRGGTGGLASMSLTCPPDIHKELDFGDCFMVIPAAEIGTPDTYLPPGLPFVVSNDLPADNLYPEGERVITWIMTDLTCGHADTCYQRVVVTFPACPDAVDCEGHHYHGVRIGCDCWTQRNLESQKYSDCTDIPCVHEYVSDTHPDADANVEVFGRLYCYEAAIRDSADNGHGHIQGICPEGWYLPTPEKYDELNTYGADALKSPLYWIPSGGYNSTGFSALPAGYYDGVKDRYEGLLGEAYFWSTSLVGGSTTPSIFQIFLNCDELIEAPYTAGMGLSVRCIKEKAHSD